ncbi:MAG: hypothetical protein J3Q66DRAFT_372847 [Benniella sp.]|nr:MAG: hypothetical protein J3Q66DRAFT_372847 [Benniella sp.]
MSTTINNLPPECLHYILFQLKDDRRSLAQLMRVSRRFLQLAAPVLYEDPFSRCGSSLKLYKTLLRSLDSSSVNAFADLIDKGCQCRLCIGFRRGKARTSDGTMSAAVAIQATYEHTPTMAPYIDFIKVFTCSRWMVHTPDCSDPSYTYTPSYSSYYLGIHDAVLQRCAPNIKSMELRRFAVSPNLLPWTLQMTSLKRLNWVGGFLSSDLDNLTQFIAGLQSQGTTRPLEEFILPQVFNDSQQLVEQDRLRKRQLMLVLGDVVSLDAHHWRDFLVICESIPGEIFSRLKQFKYRIFFPHDQGGRFLQRCRGLQKLKFATFDRNVFAWAEEERKEYDLIQLKALDVSVPKPMKGALLGSIFRVFSHCLEDLKYDIRRAGKWMANYNDEELRTAIASATSGESFRFDYTVRMPRLKRLCITQASSAVAIGQGAFQDCPVLEILSLDGKVSCSNGTEGFDVFRIPPLKSLSLGNGVARYFRLESIQHSPLLENLTLIDKLCHQPRHNEVLNMAAWTWTMPHLSTIELRGRSALAFRFEWIRQCPSLKTLYIDVLRPASLEPNMEDIAKGPCGERLQTCHLNFLKRKGTKKWLPNILETYCGHLFHLKLTRPVPAAYRDGIDLGMALTATKALASLEILTISFGPDMPALVEKYDLVRGAICNRTGKPKWFSCLNLKKLRINNSYGEWARASSRDGTINEEIVVQATNEHLPTMAPYIDFIKVLDCRDWMVRVPNCSMDSSAFYIKSYSSYYLGILDAVLQRCAPNIKSMGLTNWDICPILLPRARQMTSLKRLDWELNGGFDSRSLDNLTEFIAGLQGPGTTHPLEEFILPGIHIHGLKANNYSQQLVEQDQLRKRQLILALGNVASLNACQWKDFPAICELLPHEIFSRLRRFEYGIFFPHDQGGRFLQRCRGLQKLKFTAFDRNVFAWAEEEKEKFNVTGDVVHLKALELSVPTPIGGALLKSIFHAFSHCLEELKYNICNDGRWSYYISKVKAANATTADESFRFDYTVRMPRLKRLYITQPSSAVEIGQGAFQDCPVLEFLSLDGEVSCINGTEGFDVFRIPSLKCLSLSNGVATHFKLESIQHSPLLENLTLTDNQPYQTHQNDVDLLELDMVAWTWTMPQLSTIELYGRPALAFKFEWIRRCPSLNTLCVDVPTPAMHESNMEDIANGPCGERLRTCHLNFSKREVNEEWLSKILETYCRHLVHLKLTTPQDRYGLGDGIDLGMALTATRALNSLEILTISLGPDQVPTLVKKYALVPGMICDRTGKPTWFPYLKLKKLHIENSYICHECAPFYLYVCVLRG